MCRSKEISSQSKEAPENLQFIPSVVIFSGLPFTGKTTLSKELARRSNFVHLDCDAYRLQIVGNTQSLPDAEEAKVMVESYRRMHNDALKYLSHNTPVSLAATYWRPVYKPLLTEFVSQLNVPVKIFELHADDDHILRRIELRALQGDDSDVRTLEQYREMHKDFDPIVFSEKRTINTSNDNLSTILQILQYLDELRDKS